MSELIKLLEHALNEDAPTGDITVESLINTSVPATAFVKAKQAGIFFGQVIAETLFPLYDNTAKITTYVNDGATVEAGDVLLKIEADHAVVLKLERTLLNLLHRLCGIASLTATYVKTLNNSAIAICDTRKTTPGLRGKSSC